jgi:hypothetical protein
MLCINMEMYVEVNPWSDPFSKKAVCCIDTYGNRPHLHCSETAGGLTPGPAVNTVIILVMFLKSVTFMKTFHKHIQ